MKKTQQDLKKLPYAIIKHKAVFALITVIILIAVFIFFPRNLKKILVHGDTSTIRIVKVSTNEQELPEIILNENQKAGLLALFENSYVRLKVFHKKYVNEKFMGYYIILPGTSDTVYYFSEDIISIGGTQYKVYGKTLANKFKSIIESRE